MPKPTTGRVSPAPEPARRLTAEEEDQRNVDILMTAIFTGIALIAATVLLASAGSLGIHLLNQVADGPLTAEVGFGLGLGLAAITLGLVLRRFAERIKRRSANLYRGAWIGLIGALVIIAFMAYLPQVAFPQYCPPGAICRAG